MFPMTSNTLRPLALIAAMFLAIVFLPSAFALDRSDILLDLVSNCVDPSPKNYCQLCRAPRNDAGCGEVLECKKSTDVWALTDRFTAIRDIKMCGCPSGFVHGLAMPVYPVTGVEDPLRPEGIWQFAWDNALRRIEPESIALVVNPRQHRSQNQLHVHLLRLTSDARRRLEQEAPGHVANLDHVWDTALKIALAKGLDDYGVLVARSEQGDFMIVVTSYSPEGAFTQWSCY